MPGETGQLHSGSRWNLRGMYHRNARPKRVRLQTQSGRQPHSQPCGLWNRASRLRRMTGDSRSLWRRRYAASGTDRAWASATDRRARMQRSAWSATFSIPRTRAGLRSAGGPAPSLGHGGEEGGSRGNHVSPALERGPDLELLAGAANHLIRELPCACRAAEIGGADAVGDGFEAGFADRAAGLLGPLVAVAE